MAPFSLACTLDDTGPTFDADDGHGVAGRQRAHVGHLGDHGQRFVGVAQEHAGRSGVAGGGHGGAHVVAVERKGDDRAGQDRREDDGEGEADGDGGVGGTGAGGGRFAHVAEANQKLSRCDSIFLR